MKFQAVAEKTAKDARGLLYFDTPGRCESYKDKWDNARSMAKARNGRPGHAASTKIIH